MTDRAHIMGSPGSAEAGAAPSYGTTPELPPAYEESHNDSRQPPPSYESLYGEIRNMHRESSGICDFMLKLLKLLVSTIACTALVGIIIALPLSMIIMGGLHFHDCPREPYIPIYLVVGGSIGLAKNLVDLIRRIIYRVKGQDEENTKTNPVDSVINCFLTAWFIAGCVWIYRIYGDFDKVLNPGDPTRYCYPPLYYYAFWITTLVYVFTALCGCCLICCCCLALVAASSESSSS